MAWNLGLLGAAGGAVVIPYYIGLYGGVESDNGYGVSTDSNNNAYFFVDSGSINDPQRKVVNLKLDADANTQFQKSYSHNATARDIGIDDSGKIYEASWSSFSGFNDAVLVQRAANGDLNWLRYLQAGGSAATLPRAMAVDSSGNSHIVSSAYSAGAGGEEVHISKWDSTGALLWQRYLGKSGNDRSEGIAIDSSGNVYVSFRENTITERAGVAKYNSSGVIQWQRYLSESGTVRDGGIAVDSNGNVYLGASSFNSGAGSEDAVLAKYNSSGVIQWQKTIGKSGADTLADVKIDAEDNIYITGRDSDNSGFFVKFDGSGTVIWQRTLGATGGDQFPLKLHIGSTGAFYFNGLTQSSGSGGNDAFFGVLPADGSLLGTYTLDSVSYVYSAGTYTVSTSSLTDSAGTMTDQAGDRIATAQGVTNQDVSLTLYTDVIG